MEILPLILHFNSTMVRLKVGGAKTLKNLEIFQFHYGTIKRLNYLEPQLQQSYFNSTMVRLKVFDVKVTRNLDVKFQFHYGTIKSGRFWGRNNTFAAFQFHYGTIKRTSER